MNFTFHSKIWDLMGRILYEKHTLGISNNNLTNLEVNAGKNNDGRCDSAP